MTISLKTINALESAIDRKIEKAAAKRTRTQGVVSRTGNDGTVYAVLQGSDTETPMSGVSASVKPGDVVNVTVQGGKAYIDGNYTDPSAGTVMVAGIRGSVAGIQEQVGRFESVVTDRLEANSARIGQLEADYAHISELDVDDLEAATAYIGTLTAGNVTASDIVTDHATVGSLDATYATIASLEANYATIATLQSDYATIAQLESDYATIATLESDYATINELHSDYADIATLNANYADIHGANIDLLTADSEWVDNLMVQTGLLSKSGTVYTLDAIQVNAVNITAGTIDVERLVVTQTDQQGNQQKYLVHIDTSGSTPVTTYEKLDGNIIEPRTITADKILANSITTNEITTNNLVGTGGWINLNSGTFAYVNASSGQGISWDGQNLAIAGSVSIGNGSVLLSQMANQLKREAVYGTCSTSASTATKTVVCDTFAMDTGASITVKFANANTSTGLVKIEVKDSSSTTLLAAKNVWAAGAVTSSTNQLLWGAGAIITFTYDGTQWNAVSEPRAWYGACSTAAGTAAKEASTVNGAVICKGATFGLQMTNANAVANPTLNISSTGAKAIYIADARPSATSEYNWTAKATVDFVFDGQYYRGGDAAALAKAKSAQDAAAAAQTAANGANSRSQRIYRRYTSQQSNLSGPTTWVTSGNGYTGWSLHAPQLTYNGTKYPYIYTCVQTQTVAQQAAGSTCTCTSVQIDESTVVIDGGNIIAGTVTSTQLNATDINASNSLTVGAFTSAAQSSILNSELDDEIAAANKRTYVSIRATSINYADDSAELTATLYIDGVPASSSTTPKSSEITYAWLKDGAAISGANSSTYSVTSVGGGLEHAYSCMCSWS